MNDRPTHSSASGRNEAPEGDLVGALIRSAGSRSSPDPERLERARQAMHADWSTVVNRRRRNTRLLRLAASFVVLAIATTLVKTFWPATLTAVATVDRVVGDVLVRDAEGGRFQTDSLREPRTLIVGSELDTGDQGRALIQWLNGAQVRLDRHSLIELTSAQELRLVRGAVYIETDTNGERAKTSLSVTTSFGTARHVGTRFEVRVVDGHTQVRVREGQVIFSGSAHAPVTISGGQQLSATNRSIDVERGPGAADPAWGWLQDVAPRFAIEGRSLFDTLEWLSHESGLKMIYETEAARSQARKIILRGNIDGLDTRQILNAVLTGSGLGFDVRVDRVEIRLAEQA